MAIVKIDGIQTKIYLYKYANLYTYISVLKTAFEDAVNVLEWDEFFPEIDRSVELSVFLGTRRQVKEWLMNEKFCFTELFNYKHKYFYVKDDLKSCFNNIIGEKNNGEICTHKGKFNIRIFTNVLPEIEKFKKEEILDKMFANGFPNLNEIKIVEEDILFNRDFVTPIKEIMGKESSLNESKEKEIDLYFYGTPVNDILYLATEGVIKKFEPKLSRKDTELGDSTYLCFMVNTGRVQPKHLALIRKLVELFRACDDYAKFLGMGLVNSYRKYGQKGNFSFKIEEENENHKNNSEKNGYEEKVLHIKFEGINSIENNERDLIKNVFVDMVEHKLKKQFEKKGEKLDIKAKEESEKVKITINNKGSNVNNDEIKKWVETEFPNAKLTKSGKSYIFEIDNFAEKLLENKIKLKLKKKFGEKLKIKPEKEKGKIKVIVKDGENNDEIKQWIETEFPSPKFTKSGKSYVFEIDYGAEKLLENEIKQKFEKKFGKKLLDVKAKEESEKVKITINNKGNNVNNDEIKQWIETEFPNAEFTNSGNPYIFEIVHSGFFQIKIEKKHTEKKEDKIKIEVAADTQITKDSIRIETKDGKIVIEVQKNNNSNKSKNKEDLTITFIKILKSFKQSFNLRFLEDEKIARIIELSADHNEIPEDYKFGCSEDDLEQN